MTLDVVHLVFSAFGNVLKIGTFYKPTGCAALVQYEAVDAAKLVHADSAHIRLIL